MSAANIEAVTKFDEALREHLSLKSLPLVVRFLRRGETPPEGAGRPLRDLGAPVRPCTVWNQVRHNGVSVAMLLEDFSTACPPAMFIFGLLEPTREWLDGDLSHGIYTNSREAAVRMEQHVPRLATGEYTGLVFAPLARVDFTPDLVMVYCDSREAMRLVTAASWTTGEPLRFSMAARGLCADGVAQPFLLGRPVLAVPCGGDRTHGGTQDDELVFTAPLDALLGIVEGLDAFRRTHSVSRLGEQAEIRARYAAMSKALDAQLHRS